MICNMCSFASSSSLLLPVDSRPSFLRFHTDDVSAFFNSSKPPSPLLRHHRSFRTPTLFRLAASIAERRGIYLSWFVPDCNVRGDFGGWAIDESSVESKTGNKGLPTFALRGIGISFAVLVAVIAHFALKSKGFKFRFSSASHVFRGMLIANEDKANGSRTADAVGFDEEPKFSETIPQRNFSAVSDAGTPARMGKRQRVIIPASVDYTQLEALVALKKLKIIEDDIKGDELCTKRVYARWLVQANSLLERNPKHHIVPSILLSGSIVAAFDDVSTLDPDFWSIQEAGIIPSKLSIMNSSPDLSGLTGQGSAHFLPESFVSRQDLINWKAQLEYDSIPEKEEKIANTHMGFMDVKEINFDASPELVMDILAGDNSILRKVFGQSKRFQPNKPSTTAQAAVAIASGRLTEAIFTELSRLEDENSSRQAVLEEIKFELLGRGEIQRSWDEKLKEEESLGLEVQRAHLAAINDVELEKIVQEKNLAEYLKEKAAIDCQRQLLFSLKEEISEMSERLACERAHYISEQCDLHNMLSDLRTKREGMLDAKSLLEAEKEALRLLRSWVEDEARKNQARAKVLEEVGRRWKWETQA